MKAVSGRNDCGGAVFGDDGGTTVDSTEGQAVARVN